MMLQDIKDSFERQSGNDLDTEILDLMRRS